VNEYGFIGNGVETPLLDAFPEKPEGVYRIIVTGGSTAAGLGAANNSETIPAMLETQLNRAPPIPGKRFQVLNYGYLGGYTACELALFQYKTVYLDPDLVISLGGANDVFHACFEPTRQGLEHGVVNWSDFSYEFFNFFNGVSPAARPPLKVFTFSSRLVQSVVHSNRHKEIQSLYNSYPFYKISAHVEKKDPLLAGVTKNNLDFLAACAASRDTGLFCYLQPYALNGWKKLTDLEASLIANWLAAFSLLGGKCTPQNFSRLHEQAFAALEKTYAALDEKYADNQKMRFCSLARIFKDADGQVYLDPLHLTRAGNAIIAQRFYADIVSALSAQRRTE
jgi:lysophospholipase L1-like esterase